MDRFTAAVVASGCTVGTSAAGDLADLEIKEGAVASAQALVDYPWLADIAKRPDPSPLTTFDQGVITGELGIAETGSILVVENEIEDRLVSMMSEHLIVLVRAETVEESLDAAEVWFSEVPSTPSYAVLLTGPSRTADIERSLTIGVQGPSSTKVVIVGEQS
ncbi:MAG: LUD domain-containing protein [Acidimicrobiia bacterium]